MLWLQRFIAGIVWFAVFGFMILLGSIMAVTGYQVAVGQMSPELSYWVGINGAWSYYPGLPIGVISVLTGCHGIYKLYSELSFVTKEIQAIVAMILTGFCTITYVYVFLVPESLPLLRFGVSIVGWYIIVLAVMTAMRIPRWVREGRMNVIPMRG